MIFMKLYISMLTLSEGGVGGSPALLKAGCVEAALGLKKPVGGEGERGPSRGQGPLANSRAQQGGQALHGGGESRMGVGGGLEAAV